MIVAANPFARIPFSLKRDTTEPKTVFHLQPLDAALHARLRDRSIQYEESDKADTSTSYINPNTRALQLAKFGIKGWEHLVDEAGTPIVFDEKIHLTKQLVTGLGMRVGLVDSALDQLRPDILELGAEVERICSLKAEQVKN